MAIRLLFTIALLMLIATPAQAEQSDLGRITANLTWRSPVLFGDVQTYTLEIHSAEPVHDAYVVWLIEDNINLSNVESTMPCVAHSVNAVLCYQDVLTDTRTISLSGVVVGDVPHGQYVSVAIGDNRFEHQRFQPVSEYLGSNGTIPWVIPPRPTRVILIPDIRNE